MTAVKQNSGRGSIINTDLIDLAFMLAEAISHQQLLDMFIERTYQHWELIASSQDVVVVLEPVLSCFEEIGTERIEEILKIIKGKGVNDEIQKRLFQLGRSLIRISLRHLHELSALAREDSSKNIVNVPALAKLYSLDL